LIASRPEAHIRESFDQINLCTITRRVVLDDSFNPKKDIELVLREGFADISRNHHLMSQASNTWPGNGIIDLLVQKSSGQFIYAATVLSFVGSESFSPMKQLDIVLNPNPSHSDEAFSDLDQLYTQILSVSRNPVVVVRVLGVILTVHGSDQPAVIKGILPMEQSEVTLVLRSLHPLIQTPDTKGERYEPEKLGLWSIGADSFRLLHSSFRDYLLDERRSGRFFVNIIEFRAQLQGTIYRLISLPWRLKQGLSTKMEENKDDIDKCLYLLETVPVGLWCMFKKEYICEPDE